MSEIKTGCNDSCPYYYKNTGCIKPESFFCPPQSITYEISNDKNTELYSGVIVKEDNVSYLARKCIICGESIPYTNKSDEVVCESCKDAIAWVKRKYSSSAQGDRNWLEEEHHD